MKHLFIGGERDGEWIDVDFDGVGLHEVRIPTRTPAHALPYPTEPGVAVSDIAYENRCYKRHELVDLSGASVVMYIAESEKNPMRLLVEGYREERTT